MLFKVIQMTRADPAMANYMMKPIESNFEALNGKLKELIVYDSSLSRKAVHCGAKNFFQGTYLSKIA